MLVHPLSPHLGLRTFEHPWVASEIAWLFQGRTIMPEQLNRRLVAVMFTDMAGYTALMQRDEAAALRARKRHRAALEHSVAGRDANVLQYFGDGSLSIFTSSLHAVEAAIDIQRELGGDPALRIGLHTGDIAYDVQGAYGDAINIAARLEAICVPGGVTISQKIYDDIRRHPHLTVVPCGAVRLKNVQDAVPMYAIAVDGLALPPAHEDQGESSEDADKPDPGRERLPQVLIDRLSDLVQRPPYATHGVGSFPGRVPLVGRQSEVEQLRAMIDDAESRRGSTTFFRGPRGVGKSRLSQEVAEYARSRDWTVLTGRAHPSERLVPYAPFADALMPVLIGLDLAALAALTPGDGAALCSMFPALGQAPKPSATAHGLPGESQTRLYWQFATMLSRLASHKPLLLILEDLDFADRSSLELLGFITRQCRNERIALVVEYTGTDPERKKTLVEIEQAVLALDAGVVFELEPLSEAESATFIRQAFDLTDDDISDLVDVVYNWSRGNPFFMTGTLRGLVEGGALRREPDGWKPINLDSIELPRSVRDTVLVWMGQLSEPSLHLAGLMAVLDKQLSYEVIRHIAEVDDTEVSRSLDELVRHQVLLESEAEWTLMYSFRHPLIRELLAAELALSTRREFHTRLASSLETYYGETADEHADELAYHFGHAHPSVAGVKAIQYLRVAGDSALRRQANQEATDYLQEALDRIEAAPPGDALERIEEVAPRDCIMKSLARARRRLGEIQPSTALWKRLLTSAHANNDAGALAGLHRELGLTHMADGALEEAIEAFAAAAEWANTASDVPLVIRSQLAQALCFQATGQAEPAAKAVEVSLNLAEELGHSGLLGRVHSAALRLNIWTGHIDEVRVHAEKALSLSRASGDRGVEFWSQWAMGAMEGLIGNTSEMEKRIHQARRLADEIGSPLLHLETNELSIELAYARGDWVEGIALGHRSIELARATEQTTVLPRLLVWVSLIHLGRGDFELADELTSEAWEVSGASRVRDQTGIVDLHSVVPAHIGRASYHLARREWGEAVRIAEAGLEIADSSGYVVWAIHHILPIIGEASIEARNLGRAEEIGTRLRREAERVGHPMALAWADACDGLLIWLKGDAQAGAESLRRGAEAFESIPLTYQGAKVRRQLAGHLAEIGDTQGSLEELRSVYTVFERLGAKSELEKTRGQFRAIGADVPELA